jgi:hypothetical protein
MRASHAIVMALVASLLPALTVAGEANGSSPAADSNFAVAASAWSDATTGWALGASNCTTGRCPVLLRTADGGKSWTLLSPPAVEMSPDQNAVAFATSRDGWVTDGRHISATHDGARSWRNTPLVGADAADTSVLKLAVTPNAAYAVVSWRRAGAQVTGLFTSPRDRDRWAVVPGLTINGSGGWDVATAPDGAVFLSLGLIHQQTRLWRLVGQRWTEAPPLCGVDDAVRLAALSVHRVLALCSSDPFRGEMTKRVVDWTAPNLPHELGRAPRLGISTGFAATSTTVAIGAVGSGSSWMHTSDISFQDQTHGVAVIGSPSWRCSRLYRTTDAGATWTVVLSTGATRP